MSFGVHHSIQGFKPIIIKMNVFLSPLLQFHHHRHCPRRHKERHYEDGRPNFFMGDENDWMAGGKFCPVIVLPLLLLLVLFCMKLCNEILNGKENTKKQEDTPRYLALMTNMQIFVSCFFSQTSICGCIRLLGSVS